MSRMTFPPLLILALETGLWILIMLGGALAALVAFLLARGFLTW